MPSSQASSEGGSDPVAVLGQLAHWLATASFDCALGVALGTFAARSMRARHLHWSWAACALVLLVLARPGLHGPAFALALASLLAATRNRRWQREDIEAGGDLAELAARRQTPVDLLRTLARAGTLRLRARVAAERWTGGHELLLGVDEHRRGVSIPFDASGDGGHALVVGATGSGKTVTETSIATHAIERGMGAIVVDPKGDRDMRERVRRAALAAGREFLEWTPDGDCVYNPYALGGASEIADKALAGEQFTEPHYLRQAQRYLGHAVRVLRMAGLDVSLRALVEQLDPMCLEVLARSLPEVQAQGAHEYLDKLTPRQQSDLAGVRDRLAIMAESDIGPWLDPRTEGVQRLDLLDAAKERAVVYFNLEADRRPLLAQMLGAAIVQDLQAMVAALQGRPVPMLVVIDEFSAIVPERVVGLFARARSTGISLLLGTQELADLRVPGRELLLEQVMGNLSSLIAHRQVVPASAELIASMTETRGVWRTSQHSDGGHTRTREHENVLRDEEIRGLPRGWAAVLGLADGGCVSIARMFSVEHHR